LSGYAGREDVRCRADERRRAGRYLAGFALGAAAVGPLIAAHAILLRLSRPTDSTKLDVVSTGLLAFGFAVALLATSLAVLTGTWPPPGRIWPVALLAASVGLPWNTWFASGWVVNGLAAVAAGVLLLASQRSRAPRRR
jgi:hypothetical protein